MLKGRTFWRLRGRCLGEYLSVLLLVELALWRSGLPDILAGLPVGLDERSLDTVSNGLRFFRTEGGAFSLSRLLMRLSGETRGRKMPRLLRLTGLSDMAGVKSGVI